MRPTPKLRARLRRASTRARTDSLASADVALSPTATARVLARPGPVVTAAAPARLQAAADRGRAYLQGDRIERAVEQQLQDLQERGSRVRDAKPGQMEVRAVARDASGAIALPGISVRLLVQEQVVASGVADGSGWVTLRPDDLEARAPYELEALAADGSRVAFQVGAWTTEGQSAQLEAAADGRVEPYLTRGRRLIEGLEAARKRGEELVNLLRRAIGAQVEAAERLIAASQNSGGTQ